MIKVKNIHKRFKDNIVLDGVSFDIEKGDVIAIIGPSGTGKSTLLRSINLLEHPEEGEIEFDDFSLDYGNHKKKDELDLRKKTTMVFQQFNLFQKKTALENVMEGLMVVQKLPKSEAKKIAIEKLRQVKMDDRLDYYPKHLSGGQQQRVAIARAVALKPELLLLDEPTSALDPELVGEVLDTIRTLAEEGNTMLIVSHEMSFVKSVANKVIFLENGRIVEQGSQKDIFENPQNERTVEFLLKNRVELDLGYNI
ncbi:amino acid ABC transporter ATP-binding protein [Butyrivibrio sp. JL13D10]|uniref:amino acid ABC transporter ATP-binding protein n=1 Tax=Butyrivibrio sp. JL13D10 TaxID=3236815 RepID=UPI0038B5E56C